MTHRTVSIEIYSEVACPWCYVGKRRLERALGQLKDRVKPQIAWRPFQLNPTMPAEGMERGTYLEAKFGGLDSFRRIEESLLQAGAGEQISFAFEKIARTPNTFQAHRLIWYGGQKGLQEAIVESLFRGYFEEGADIGSIPTLVQLAEQAGLKAEAFLRGDEGTKEVKVEEAEGHRLGIRAVPYFVLNQVYGISGAQPVEVFVSAMQNAGTQASMGVKGLSVWR